MTAAAPSRVRPLMRATVFLVCAFSCAPLRSLRAPSRVPYLLCSLRARSRASYRVLCACPLMSVPVFFEHALA
eukprot:7780861-Alexandrium_andersonii.AAC.1